jgi:hypothetical protein
MSKPTTVQKAPVVVPLRGERVYTQKPLGPWLLRLGRTVSASAKDLGVTRETMRMYVQERATMRGDQIATVVSWGVPLDALFPRKAPRGPRAGR